MINERQLIDDEYEANFATNTLGTYILTKNLIPVLLQNQPCRVFITSSGGMEKKNIYIYIFLVNLSMSTSVRYVQC